MSGLSQLNNQVTISVEEQESVDGQGKPTYADATELVVQRVQFHSPVRGARTNDKTLVTLPDGTQTHAALTLFIDASATSVPGLNARITLNARVYLVIDVAPLHSLDNTLHHTKVSCKAETI